MLTLDCEDYARALDEARANLRKAEDKAISLEKELIEARIIIAGLESQLYNLRAENDKLRLDASGGSEQMIAIQVTITELRDELGLKNKNLRDLNNELNLIKKTYDDLVGDNDDLRNRLKDRENELARLNDTVRELKSVNDDLSKGFGDTQNQLKRIKSELMASLEENRKLKDEKER